MTEAASGPEAPDGARSADAGRAFEAGAWAGLFHAVFALSSPLSGPSLRSKASTKLKYSEA
jgi:hypothetical protein